MTEWLSLNGEHTEGDVIQTVMTVCENAKMSQQSDVDLQKRVERSAETSWEVHKHCAPDNGRSPSERENPDKVWRQR